MEDILARRAIGAGQQARAKLRDQGCEWVEDVGVDREGDSVFSDDASAIRWLEEQYRTGKKAEAAASSDLSRVALDAAKLLHRWVNELPAEAIGTELSVNVAHLSIPYQVGTGPVAFVPVTTAAMRLLHREALEIAGRFKLTHGQSTALIMTGRAPSLRGRPKDADAVDDFLKEVLREMKEDGRPVPPRGRAGVNSGVADFWREVLSRFNAELGNHRDMRRHMAAHFTTLRSRYWAICGREPEFREEMESQDG